MKTLLLALTVLLPWALRRWLLCRLCGYDIHPTARIGLSWVFPGRLKMEAHARIGHLTVCKNLGLVHLGEHSSVGNLDWITGFPPGPSRHFAHQPERRPELIVGAHSAITHRHLIDCTATVTIGPFTTFAGFQSQILSHSIDLAASRQSSAPVTIGAYCFVGTNCVLLGGAVLPDRSVLGAKSLLNKAFADTHTLYGGVPARALAHFGRGNGVLSPDGGQRRVRVLHVASSLDPRGGGVAEAVRQMGAALVRAGHATAAVTVDPPGAPYLAGMPFPVHALGPSRGSYQYARGLEAFLSSQRGDFDCLITHGLWQHHGFAAWRAWPRETRFVFAHGMLDPWFKRTYPRKHLKKWLYWPWAEYRILRGARAVFFTCEEERRLARESFWLYRANEAVNPLGIEEPPGNAEQQKETFLQRFPELRGRRLVLFLGRLTEKKGCQSLLMAFTTQAVRKEEVTLVMAGPEGEHDRPFVEMLRELSDRLPVCWTGMLTGDLKWGALRAAEAFILPSHQENFGIAVVEALACGKPVLISDKVNIWREIEADAAGLVDDDNFKGTSKLLLRWQVQTAEERAAMGRRARASFERRYQIDRATAALVDQLRGFGVRGVA